MYVVFSGPWTKSSGRVEAESHSVVIEHDPTNINEGLTSGGKIGTGEA